MTGSCSTAGGSLGHTSSGFTPNGTFTVTANYPDGRPYPLATTTGRVYANGSVPWSWPCAGDPAGTYTTDLTDTATHRSSGPIHFTIQPGTGTGTGTGTGQSSTLRFAVTGSCSTAGGSLGHTSSGFTPNGTFTVTANYPDGRPYPLATTTGRVYANGSVPWSWPCAGDPAGTYTTDLTDTATHRSTGPIHFTIQPSHPAALHFAVTGSCTTAGGSLGHTSSGFTPNGTFTVTANYPDGRPYPLATTTGRVYANGSVPWSWPCAGDPAGTYTTDLTDTATHRSTGPIHFTIQPK